MFLYEISIRTGGVIMNSDEAHQFITNYFKRLFTDRDLTVLDEYLHPNHWDDVRKPAKK